MKTTRTTRRGRPIYVQSRMRVPMEQLRDATQNPEQHQRWDVRFGSITYLHKVDGEPQRFTYATTVAPGVTVAGTGESLGDRDRPDGTRWSGLKFWANDRPGFPVGFPVGFPDVPTNRTWAGIPVEVAEGPTTPGNAPRQGILSRHDT